MKTQYRRKTIEVMLKNILPKHALDGSAVSQLFNLHGDEDSIRDMFLPCQHS